MTDHTIDPISYSAGIEADTPERILYVCESCADNNLEGCAHFDRRDVRVAPNGQWLCEDCFEGAAFGKDDEAPLWRDLPPAPEYGPLHRTEPQTAPDAPAVTIKPMKLSDGRTDFFVSIRVCGREVTPHVYREEYKAAYHVALYNWLLNSGEKPDLMAFNPGDFPAQPVADTAPADAERPAEEVETVRAELRHERDWRIRLQAALMYWHPGVSEKIEIETNGRAGADAGLLAGFEGELPEQSWGESAVLEIQTLRKRVKELEEALAPFSLIGGPLNAVTEGVFPDDASARFLNLGELKAKHFRGAATALDRAHPKGNG